MYSIFHKTFWGHINLSLLKYWVKWNKCDLNALYIKSCADLFFQKIHSDYTFFVWFWSFFVFFLFWNRVFSLHFFRFICTTIHTCFVFLDCEPHPPLKLFWNAAEQNFVSICFLLLSRNLWKTERKKLILKSGQENDKNGLKKCNLDEVYYRLLIRYWTIS